MSGARMESTPESQSSPRWSVRCSTRQPAVVEAHMHGQAVVAVAVQQRASAHHGVDEGQVAALCAWGQHVEARQHLLQRPRANEVAGRAHRGVLASRAENVRQPRAVGRAAVEHAQDAAAGCGGLRARLQRAHEVGDERVVAVGKECGAVDEKASGVEDAAPGDPSRW